MPLDRQRKRFKSQYGVDFSVSWLSDLVKRAGFWLEAVYCCHIDSLLKADYLCADETPIPVLCRDVRGRTHRGYFWVYFDPLNKVTVFDYRRSRSAQGPVDFLGAFSGTLQVDGYDGYNEVIAHNGICRAGCMDHVRRRFDKAKDYDRERAVFLHDTMRTWYKVEEEARNEGLSAQERFEKRRAITLPSMAGFKHWLDTNLSQVLPKSPMVNVRRR